MKGRNGEMSSLGGIGCKAEWGKERVGLCGTGMHQDSIPIPLPLFSSVLCQKNGSIQATETCPRVREQKLPPGDLHNCSSCSVSVTASTTAFSRIGCWSLKPH